MQAEVIDRRSAVRVEARYVQVDGSPEAIPIRPCSPEVAANKTASLQSHLAAGERGGDVVVRRVIERCGL